MAGVWRKTMMYLGLVEDEDLEEQGGIEEHADLRAPALPHAGRRAGRSRRGTQGSALPSSLEAEGIVRTIPTRTQASEIHRAEPRRFNEARELGEKFKEGVPVIMNLQQTEDPTARRLVDFASGLVFALEGKIELVASRVYLLTPQDVDVSAEQRQRLSEGEFFNQF
jgi:cell division inhibitor SepF